MKARPIRKKTDNTNLAHKVGFRIEMLRRFETQAVSVLDLYAGTNKIWDAVGKHVQVSRYYGVDIVDKKGKNITADNAKIIPSLDLSAFNVIDIDAYGTPIKPLFLLYENKTLQKGTIVFCTEIHSGLSKLPIGFFTEFKLKPLYKKSEVLFNKKAGEFCFGMLGNRGVSRVWAYGEHGGSNEKNYFCFAV